MLIKTLDLTNFRGFSAKTIRLSDRFNLLVGDNGTGKTAIIDALAIGAGSLFLGFPDVKLRNIRKEEVRFESFVHGQTFTFEKQYPTVVRCEGIVDDQEVEWKRTVQGHEGMTLRQYATKLKRIGENLSSRVANGEEVVLPVVSYYGTGRLWVQKKQSPERTTAPGSRFFGYLDCLNPVSTDKTFVEWFKTRELESLQRNQNIDVLEAVKHAIIDCVEDAQSVRFDIQTDEIVLQVHGRPVPFSYLSDGYRNMLATAADVAHRASILNPHLGELAARQTPGLVLIDEIDLHLHPKWQRRVVRDLLKAFPRVQFVATTHSPFIVQSLPNDPLVQLLNLDNEDATDYVNKSVEDIAEDVQGIEHVQRSQRYLDMMETAKKYYQLLKQGSPAKSADVQQLKQELDRLVAPFSNEPAYQAFLDLERAAAGLGEPSHEAG